MKVAIAGSGAMGGRFGYMLSKAGITADLIDCWQVHVEEILKNGLSVNDDGQESKVHLPIYFPEQIDPNTADYDLIILFTKSLQLDDMLKAITPILKPHTSVLCLLNGLGHEVIIEKYVSKDNIFIGCTMWTAGLEGPGKIKLLGKGNIALQDFGNNSKDKAMQIVDLLNSAGFEAHYSEHVMQEIYKKACANGSTNAICTLLEANLNTFGNTSCAESIVRSFIDEYANVAAVEGVELDREMILSFVKKAFDPEGIGRHFPSMYQDLILTNRKTEVDCINGIIAEKGAKYGISTPYCSFITELIHCREEILGAV